MGSATGRFQHIEGLRGVAIIFVILFHAFPELFPMGYFGVDVFLVISGYLLFLRPFKVEEGRVLAGCRDYVCKKIARLLPALLVTVTFVMTVGALILTPEDMVTAAKTGVAAITCTSNMYLDTLASDYFAADTAYNALVHTWYLSVIFQVYLLYMFGSVVLRKAGKAWVWGVLVPVALGSLSCSDTFVSLVNKVAGTEWKSFGLGYYSTSSRLWEILAGGAVALLPGIRCKWLKTALALAGVALVALLSAVEVQAGANIRPFLLVAGAMLCVAYAGDGLPGRILCFAPLRYIGNISFSLYLAHLPVLVFLRSVPETPVWLAVAGGAALMLALAIPLFKWVEQHRFTFRGTAALWGVAGLSLGATLLWNPSRFCWSEPPHYAPYADVAPICDEALHQGFDEQYLMPTDILLRLTHADEGLAGQPLIHMGVREGMPSVLLMGDSHSYALFPGLDTFCKEAGVAGAATTAYIIPLHDREAWGAPKETHHWYPEKEEALFRWLAMHPEIRTVVIAQRWWGRLGKGKIPAESAEALRGFVQRLHDMGRQVLLVAPAVELETPSTMRAYRLGTDRCMCHHLQGLTRAEAGYRKQMGGVLDTLDALEQEGLCHVLHIERPLFHDGVFHAIQNGEWLMYDDDHLSPAGSIKAVKGCREELRRFLER